jgi:hypothetical protein
MAATDLIKIEEAKFWLDDPTGEKKDALLDKIITYSSGLILKYLDRRVMVNTSAITEYHSWVPGFHLWTYEWPIQSVTSVHESTARTYDSTSLLTANTDYVVVSPGDERAKIVRTNSATDSPINWYRGFRYQQVIYTPGYADKDSVPSAIKDVCCRHVSTVYKEVTKQLGGIDSASGDFGSVNRFGPALLTSGMKMDLNHFRRASFVETGERDS